MQPYKKKPGRQNLIRLTFIFFTGEDYHQEKVDRDAENVEHWIEGKIRLIKLRKMGMCHTKPLPDFKIAPDCRYHYFSGFFTNTGICTPEWLHSATLSKI